MRALSIAGFLALALVWGSEWILTASLPSQPLLLSTALRYAMAATVLLPWAVHEKLWQRPWHELARSALLGIGVLALPQILIFVGGHHLGAGWALFALALVPILLAIGGDGEITTTVCGFAGVVFLIADSLNVTVLQIPWLLCPLAAAMVLAWSLASAARRLGNTSLAGSLFVQCAAAALTMVAAARGLEQQAFSWSSAAWIGLASSAVLATVGAYLLFYWLLVRLGAGRVSMLQWLQMAVAAGESAALMHVRPGWHAGVGLLLVTVALIVAFRETGRDGGVMLQITQG